jgi:hypothetical protein
MVLERPGVKMENVQTFETTGNIEILGYNKLKKYFSVCNV